ncbi:hypothetical protein [Campylobacter upsaliensis]|uniref:hypothetical protein n=1 Tax=Campylobacter upsaliensis TaxID=28080 RepID=UPI00214A1AE5|nr:hypothetical protein [Campylobacter upsaliensis]MCR2098805.1 hypothetical protein [Campylobacter upsaliensis]
MLELLKNVGLGIFVNGIFTIQQGDFSLGSILSVIEGVVTMWVAIMLSKRNNKK